MGYYRNIVQASEEEKFLFILPSAADVRTLKYLALIGMVALQSRTIRIPFSLSFMEDSLTIFLITPYRPNPHCGGIERQSVEVMAKLVEAATLEIECAHRLDEIAQRVDARERLRPFWHTRYWGD